MSATHTLPNSLLYEHSDVPPGVSLRAWRKANAAPARKRRLTSLMRPRAARSSAA
jgi:hypothetical protein